jgi:hypothetical protein
VRLLAQDAEAVGSAVAELRQRGFTLLHDRRVRCKDSRNSGKSSVNGQRSGARVHTERLGCANPLPDACQLFDIALVQRFEQMRTDRL